MGVVSLKGFKGLMPRIAPTELPDQSAQTAINCLFGSGSLRPLQGNGAVTVADPLVSGTKVSMFEYTGSRWLAWITDVNVCRSSVAMDSFDRIYWTGDVAPRMAGNATLLAGGAALPGGYWPLGIEKPATAITPSGTAGSSVDAVTYSYVYTYVSIYGEEGPPSTPSATITVEPLAEVTLSGMTFPGGRIASINIYRSNTGTDATEYQFLVSRTSAADYVDTIASANLGEVLPSETWIAPNSAMKGLISHPGGFVVGFYNNVLCPSEAYLPHAYPAAYQTTVDAEIVAIGAFGNSILVTTKGMPYILTGSDPGQLSIEKLEKGEACILKRGFVDMGYACIYPGPSGLWIAGTGTVELMTASLMTKKEWSDYSRTMTFAVRYGDLYIGFMASGGFVLDTTSGDFSTHDITATAGWYDDKTGRLYLVVGGVIVEWSTSATAKQLTWKSKKYQAPAPTNFGACQVFSSGPVTVKISADGVLKHTETQVTTNSLPFRLPSGFLATAWEVQVEGSAEITSVQLAGSFAELAQA